MSQLFVASENVTALGLNENQIFKEARTYKTENMAMCGHCL